MFLTYLFDRSFVRGAVAYSSGGHRSMGAVSSAADRSATEIYEAHHYEGHEQQQQQQQQRFSYVSSSAQEQRFTTTEETTHQTSSSTWRRET